LSKKQKTKVTAEKAAPKKKVCLAPKVENAIGLVVAAEASKSDDSTESE
jgi:hypothetical protein